jgi:hypothetical protein
MATFYLVLEITALLGVIIFPIAGPKVKAKTKNKRPELSNLYVNENGYLEYAQRDDNKDQHLPVH